RSVRPRRRAARAHRGCLRAGPGAGGRVPRVGRDARGADRARPRRFPEPGGAGARPVPPPRTGAARDNRDRHPSVAVGDRLARVRRSRRARAQGRGGGAAPGGPALRLAGARRGARALARRGEALLGSTMEHAGFDCRVTNEGLAQIFRGAIRLFPGLLREPVLRMWAGLRPLTADGRPIVGAHPGVERLWYATGHGRNGVLLAALTGETVGDGLS